MLTHGGIAHYVAAMPHKEMVNALRSYGSVYACITTLSFDMSVMGYALALANGLTVYFASEEECNNADLLAARMMENKVDVISDVPSRIFTLLGAESFRRKSPFPAMNMTWRRRIPLPWANLHPA